MFKSIVKAKRGIPTRTRNHPPPEPEAQTAELDPSPSFSSSSSETSSPENNFQQIRIKCQPVSSNGDDDDFPGQGQQRIHKELTEEDETILYKMLCTHKPLGVNKHFNVLEVITEFKSWTGRQLDGEAVWKKLQELYDLEALEQVIDEGGEHPVKEVDFDLPASYNDLKVAHVNLRFNQRRPSRTRTTGM